MHNNFFFLIIIPNLLAENCTLRNFYRKPLAQFHVEFFGCMLTKSRESWEKMENFLAVKLYDFVFSYERSEYAEQRKN